MIKNMLAFGLLSFSLFSCGDASGGNKNIIPKDPNAVTETQSDSTEMVQKADTITKQDKPDNRENATQVKADSITVKSEIK